MDKITEFFNEITTQTIFLNKSLIYNDNATQLLEENTSENYLTLWREQTWFTDNKIKFVNVHWLKFPPPTKNAHALLAVIYIVLMIVGFTGNSLVIFMFMRCRSLRSPANILVANLAVSDLIMILKIPLFIYHSMHDGLPLGNIACKIYGFIGGLSGTVSICTLSCIAIDRFYVVVYPLSRSVTTLRSKICIVISWLYGCIFAFLPLTNTVFGSYVPEGYLTSCSFDYLTSDDSIRYFITCYFFAAWVIPFLIISICYFKIIRVVLLAKNLGNKMKDPTVSLRHCREQEQKKKEIRLALVILIIIGLWFAAWTPYAVVALLGISGQKNLITPLSSMIPALFCKTASCLDPFVYAVTNQVFKEELKLLFCKRRTNRNMRNKRVWSTKISQEPAIRYSINSEEEVEEIYIPINITDIPCTPLTNKKTKDLNYQISQENVERDVVQPTTATTMMKERSLSCIGRQSRTSWIFRPNFSNDSSNIRRLARSCVRSKDSSVEEQ